MACGMLCPVKWLLAAAVGCQQMSQRVILSKYFILIFWLCIGSSTFIESFNYSRDDHLQEAVQEKGLRDDTTCIVVDILPPEKITPTVPPPKKQGMGVFKNMFRRKSSESSSNVDREYSEPDVVEEIFEDGSAMLAQRLVSFS